MTDGVFLLVPAVVKVSPTPAPPPAPCPPARKCVSAASAACVWRKSIESRMAAASRRLIPLILVLCSSVVNASAISQSLQAIARWLGISFADEASNDVLSSTARESIRALHFERCKRGPTADSLLDDVLKLVTGTDLPYSRVIIPGANAILHKRVCIDPISKQTFRPYLGKPLTFRPCPLTTAEAGQAMRPSCRIPGTGIYEPCPNRVAVPLIPSRFCSEKAEVSGQRKVTLQQLRSFEDVPKLAVAMPEANVHPTNINHFTRDIIFAVTMARYARRVGWRAVVGTPPRSKMNSWTIDAIDALYSSGLLVPDDESDASRSHAVCHTTATKISSEDVASAEVIDEMGCAMRAFCNVTQLPTRRTLLYVARVGDAKATRTVINMDEAALVMRRYARQSGLDFKLVSFGGRSFCDQVRLVSEAAVVFGVHGADINNALLAPRDAIFVEAYPTSWGASAEIGGRAGFGSSSETVYAKQVMRGSRRHVVARIFNVLRRQADSSQKCDTNATQSSNWQYAPNCVLSIDLVRLRDLLEVLTDVLRHSHRLPARSRH